MFKRISGLILSCVLLFSSLAAALFGASAADGENVGGKLTVLAVSNYFPEALVTYEEGIETVSVTYMIQLNDPMVSAEWYIYYNPEILNPTAELNLSEDGNGYSFMPQVGKKGSLFNINSYTNTIAGNCSSLAMYDLTSYCVFVQAAFEVVGMGDTVLNLYVRGLTTGEYDDSGERLLDGTELSYVSLGVINGAVCPLAADTMLTESNIKTSPSSETAATFVSETAASASSAGGATAATDGGSVPTEHTTNYTYFTSGGTDATESPSNSSEPAEPDGEHVTDPTGATDGTDSAGMTNPTYSTDSAEATETLGETKGADKNPADLTPTANNTVADTADKNPDDHSPTADNTTADTADKNPDAAEPTEAVDYTESTEGGVSDSGATGDGYTGGDFSAADSSGGTTDAAVSVSDFEHAGADPTGESGAYSDGSSAASFYVETGGSAGKTAAADSVGADGSASGGSAVPTGHNSLTAAVLLIVLAAAAAACAYEKRRRSG